MAASAGIGLLGMLLFPSLALKYGEEPMPALGLWPPTPGVSLTQKLPRDDPALECSPAPSASKLQDFTRRLSPVRGCRLGPQCLTVSHLLECRHRVQNRVRNLKLPWVQVWKPRNKERLAGAIPLEACEYGPS